MARSLFLFTLFSATLWAADGLRPVVVSEEAPPARSASRLAEFPGVSLPVDQAPTQGLSAILARSPSIFVPPSGQDATYAPWQIRGQDSLQSRAFLESVPLTDAQFNVSAMHWVPLEALTGVDLFAEGAPAHLGTDGLGGALVLRLQPEALFPNRAGLRLGSFGQRRLLAQAGVRPWRLGITAEAALSQEDFLYRSDSGTPLVSTDDKFQRRENNGWRALTLLPQWEVWSRGANRARVFGLVSLRENEIAGATGAQAQGVLSTGYFLAAAELKAVSGRWEWEGSLHALDNQQTFQGPAPVWRAFSVRSTRNLSAGARVLGRAGWSASSESEVLLGASVHGVTQRSDAGVESQGVRGVVPASLAWHQTWGEWAGHAAVHAEGVYETGNPQLWFSPRLGGEWNISAQHRGRWSAGRYFRLPTLAERYGTPARVSPNPGLQAEQAWKTEVGWDTRLRWEGALQQLRVSASVSGSWALETLLLSEGAVGSFRYSNGGASEIFSQEASLEAQWARGLFSTVAISLLQSQDQSGDVASTGHALPFRPGYRTRLSAGIQRQSWDLSYQWSVTGGFFSDAANSQWVGAYGDHSVHAAWRSAWGTLSLDLLNLGDATLASGSDWGFFLNQNTSGLAGFPVPGRRVVVAWQSDL
ncbi:TonB-dependent receptor [bacterium]|nr:TonB-dependent receptor [bacterium]